MVSANVKAQLGLAPVFLLYFLATRLSLPGQQQLLYDKFCYQYYEVNFNAGMCNNKDFIQAHPDIQEHASLWSVYLQICEIGPAIFTSIYIGIYCDNISQKGPLLLNIFNQTLVYALLVLQAYYVQWSATWMLIPSLLNGLCGSFITYFIAVMSILSKCTVKKERSFVFIIIECFMPIGILAARFSSGYILQYWGTMWIYVIASAVMLLDGILGLILIKGSPVMKPESIVDLPPHQSVYNNSNETLDEDPAVDISPAITLTPAGVRSPTWWQLFHWKYLKDLSLLLFTQSERKNLKVMWLVILAYTIMDFAGAGTNELFYLYFTKEFGYTEVQYSYYSTGYSTAAIVGALVGPIVLIKLVKMNDLSLCVLAFLGQCLCGYSYGIAPWNSAFLWPPIGLNVFYSCGVGALKSLLTKSVESKNIGKVFCLLYSVQGVSVLGSASLFGSLYAACLTIYAGIPYFVSAAIAVVGLTACTVLRFIYSETVVVGSDSDDEA